MRKNLLTTVAASLILAFVHHADAQQPKKVPRIGLLISASNVIAPFTDAFRQGMRELGYVEGKNFVLEIRGGGAEPDRLSDLAAELVRLKVDIIVAAGSLSTPCRHESDQHDSDRDEDGGRSGKIWACCQSGASGWKYHGSVCHERGAKREAFGATRGGSSRA